MSYSTVDDLKKLIPEATLIQLTNDEGVPVTTIDPENPDCAAVVARIDEAIAQADSEIDSYCGAKYRVPFTSAVPDIVRKCSVDIAIYNLYSRIVEEIPQARADRYRNTARLLENIARGVISIGEDPAPPARSGGQPECTTSSGRVFTRTKMEGF